MTRQRIKATIFSLLLINLIALYFLRLYTSPIESSIFFKIILTSFIIWVWYLAYLRDKYEQLIVITFFLTIFNIDKLYLGISVPISIILFLAALFASLLFLASIRLNMAHTNPFVLLYSLLVGLVTAESFLAASIWAPNNATLGAVVSVSFYFVWHLILGHLNHKLTPSRTWQYSIYCFVAVLLIIITASWYTT